MTFLKLSTTTISAFLVTTSLVAISACSIAPEPETSVSNKDGLVAATPNVQKPFPRVVEADAAPITTPAVTSEELLGIVSEVNSANIIAQPSGRLSAEHLPVQYFGSPQQGYVQTGDTFAPIDRNGIKAVAADPVSTFSVDVDTGAYSLVRDRLNGGMLPNPDAVRIEEMIN